MTRNVNTDELGHAWTAVRSELIGFVARRVESSEVAEDIVHDVLERFQRRDDQYPVDNVNAWLYRSARNAIVDHYRKRRQHDPLPTDLELLDTNDSSPNAATRELSNCLRPLVDRLPDKYRTAIISVDLDGHTHAAAAAEQAVSVSGMKSRVQRGRAKLGELLTECCNISTDDLGQIADCEPNRDQCPC